MSLESIEKRGKNDNGCRDEGGGERERSLVVLLPVDECLLMRAFSAAGTGRRPMPPCGSSQTRIYWHATSIASLWQSISHLLTHSAAQSAPAAATAAACHTLSPSLSLSTLSDATTIHSLGPRRSPQERTKAYDRDRCWLEPPGRLSPTAIA